eukprot:257881_1
MSLTKAIQFRHLITQLTNVERTGFLSKLLDSHVDMIISSLFRHFVKANQIDELNAFNASLFDIIQSRKEKPKAISTRNVRLYQLPRAIIGHTASFLQQKDYIHFSMSNRFIYLGCNSPNLLQKLNLYSITDYSSISLSSFPSVNFLYIEPLKAIASAHTLSFDSPNFNHVATLVLTHADGNTTRGWVEPFFNQNIVNCETVTKLDGVLFGDDGTDGSEVLNLLGRFPNLKAITLSGLYTDNVTSQDIANLCPNVVELCVDGGNLQLTEDLIAIFSSKLKSLGFTEFQNSEFHFDTLIMDQLEELTMIRPSYQSLEGIVKTASNLKKIFLSISISDVDDNDLMHDLDIKNGMTKLIVKCSFLTCMSFAVKWHGFCAMLEGIESGLLQTKRQRRAELKITINICGVNVSSNDSITLNVGRVINTLESSDINDFMFICKFLHVLSDDVNDIFEALSNIISIHTKIIRVEHCTQLIIANQNCKISGYRNSIFNSQTIRLLD